MEGVAAYAAAGEVGVAECGRELEGERVAVCEL